MDLGWTSWRHGSRVGWGLGFGIVFCSGGFARREISRGKEQIAVFA